MGPCEALGLLPKHSYFFVRRRDRKDVNLSVVVVVATAAAVAAAVAAAAAAVAAVVGRCENSRTREEGGNFRHRISSAFGGVV